jgi:hypothetical protein
MSFLGYRMHFLGSTSNSWCLPSEKTTAIAGEVSGAEINTLREPTTDSAHWIDGVRANGQKAQTVESRALLPIRWMGGGMTPL